MPKDVCVAFSNHVTSLGNRLNGLKELVPRYIGTALLNSQIKIVDKLEGLRTLPANAIERIARQGHSNETIQHGYDAQVKKKFSEAILSKVNVHRVGLAADKVKPTLLDACMEFQANHLTIIVSGMIDELLKNGVFVPAEINEFSLPFDAEVFRVNFEMIRPDYVAIIEKRTTIAFDGLRKHVEKFKDRNVFTNSTEAFTWHQMINELEITYNRNVEKLKRNEHNLNDFEDFQSELSNISDIYVEFRQVYSAFDSKMLPHFNA